MNFDTIRPRTLYSNNKKTNPLSGPGNGTVIALSNFDSNKAFCNYSNGLALFLLKDKTIKSYWASILGKSFLQFGALWDIIISGGHLGSVGTLKTSLNNTIT